MQTWRKSAPKRVLVSLGEGIKSHKHRQRMLFEIERMAARGGEGAARAAALRKIITGSKDA